MSSAFLVPLQTHPEIRPARERPSSTELSPQDHLGWCDRAPRGAKKGSHAPSHLCLNSLCGWYSAGLISAKLLQLNASTIVEGAESWHAPCLVSKCGNLALSSNSINSTAIYGGLLDDKLQSQAIPNFAKGSPSVQLSGHHAEEEAGGLDRREGQSGGASLPLQA